MTDPIHDLAVRLVDVERRLHDMERVPQLGHSSIEDGSIGEYADGTAVARYGAQFDGSHMAASLAGPTPPRPSAPILEPLVAGAKARWDGEWADPDAITPMDHARVEFHAATTAPVASDDYNTFGSFRAAISSPRGGDTVLSLRDAVPQTWYVWLVARTLSGQYGPPSEVVVVTPDQVTTVDIAPGSLDASAVTQPGTITADLFEAVLILASEIVVGDEGAGHFVISGLTNKFIAYRSDGVTKMFELDPVNSKLTSVGSFATAPSGQRIVVNEGGTNALTIRFYGAAGTNHGALWRVNDDLVVTSVSAGGDNGSGQTSQLQLSQGQALLSHMTARQGGSNNSSVGVFPNQVATLSPTLYSGIRNQTGTAPHNWTIAFLNSLDQVISPGWLEVRLKAGTNEIYISAPGANSGILFGGNGIFIVNGTTTPAFGPVYASSFNVSSDANAKTPPEDLEFSALDAVRAARVGTWSFLQEAEDPGEVEVPGVPEQEHGEGPQKPRKARRVKAPRPTVRRRIGPVAQDLPPDLVHEVDGVKCVDLASQVGLLMAAVQELAGQVAGLRERLGE